MKYREISMENNRSIRMHLLAILLAQNVCLSKIYVKTKQFFKFMKQKLLILSLVILVYIRNAWEMIYHVPNTMLTLCNPSFYKQFHALICLFLPQANGFANYFLVDVLMVDFSKFCRRSSRVVTLFVITDFFCHCICM